MMTISRDENPPRDEVAGVEIPLQDEAFDHAANTGSVLW